MNLAVALFGVFVAALGIAGLMSPERLLGLVTRAQSRLGLGFIATIRLLLGGALLLAAASSRAPRYLQLLGWLSIVSGAVTPLFGVRRFEAILEWWGRRAALFVRLWSGFVVVFGASLIWAVFPRVG